MNPTVRLLFAFALVTAGIGLAASDAVAVDPQPTKSNVPRPPGLNDPGVSTTASAPPKDATNGATDDANEDPLAPVAKPDARLARDKASRDASATAEASREALSRARRASGFATGASGSSLASSVAPFVASLGGAEAVVLTPGSLSPGGRGTLLLVGCGSTATASDAAKPMPAVTSAKANNRRTVGFMVATPWMTRA